MKRQVFSVALLTLVLLLPACSTLDSAYPIETVYPETPEVYFRKLTAVQSGNQLIVSGKLKKRSLNAVVSHGHVYVTVYNTKGKLLAETIAPYESSLNLRGIQQRGGNRFYATLGIIPPSGSLIKVAFQPGEPTAGSNPDHE